MYAGLEDIKPTFTKLNAIALGATDVIITQEEFSVLIETMEGVPDTFKMAMDINLFVYITAVALLNRIAFAKLTEQPFIF